MAGGWTRGQPVDPEKTVKMLIGVICRRLVLKSGEFPQPGMGIQLQGIHGIVVSFHQEITVTR